MGTFLHLLRETLVSTFRDGCLSIARAAAYSLILAFFPTLLLLAALLATGRTTAALMREITYALGRVLPPTTEHGALQYFSAKPQHSLRLMFSAAAIGLLAASGVMTSFMQGSRAAYRLGASWSLWKEEGVAFALVFLAGAPLLAATALIVFGQQVQNWLIYRLGLTVFLTAAWVVGRWVVAVATCTLVLGIIYFMGPHAEERFYQVLPGALLATVAWLITTSLFTWYVTHLADYSDIYGSFGAGVALLIWMYLLAVIVLIGAEFNAVCQRRRRDV